MAGAADFQRSKTHCKNGHPFDEVNTRHRNDRRERVCRACHNESEKRRRERPEEQRKALERMQRWRENNREKDRARHRKRREKQRGWLELLKAKGCVQCGEDNPGCLDFHHRDPTTKEFQIGRASLVGHSKEAIEAEMAKCDILCANCHRRLHYEERQQKREAAA